MSIYVIAEMAWAHDGSLEKAINIMKEAKKAGADAISIHVTDLEDYMVPYYGSGEGKLSAGREELDVYQYLVDINLSNHDWEIFSRETRQAGIDLCVMPNDRSSLDFAAKKMNPDSYVVAAASFAEEVFLNEIALQNKKTFFRIGGAYLGEIEKAVNLFRGNGNQDIVLLHGIQMYPTKLEDTNIAFLESLSSIFNVEVGLADHIDGGSPFAKVLPLLAIPYGGRYIEKHITFDRNEKGEDFESALNPGDLKEFVEFVRAAEIATGSPVMSVLSEAQLKYRNVVRKKIVARQDIPGGQAITIDDIAYKRCDVGLSPDETGMILGRKTSAEIKKDEVLTLDKLAG